MASRVVVVLLMCVACYIKPGRDPSSSIEEAAAAASSVLFQYCTCVSERERSSRLTEEEREYSFGFLIKVIVVLVDE